MSILFLLNAAVCVPNADAQTCALPPTTITAPSSLCAYTNAVASVPDAGPGATYAWTITGGSIVAGGATDRAIFKSSVFPSQTAQLAVTVTTAGGCSTGSTAVQVDSHPHISVRPGYAAQCPNTTGLSAWVLFYEDAAYSWSIVNGTITSATNTSSITFDTSSAGPTEITVIVTRSGGCVFSNKMVVPAYEASSPDEIGIAVSDRTFTSIGGAGQFHITTECAWSAVSSAPWLTITSSSSGVGNGTVSFAVAPNLNLSARAATVTIAGAAISINQRNGGNVDGNALKVQVLAGRDQGFGYRDGPGVTARFSRARDLVLSESGDGYIADTHNHVVRRIDPAGNLTVFAGAAGMAGYRDGAGSDARFSNPSHLAMDSAGNLFVSEPSRFSGFANNTIRKITPTGVVSTISGKPGVAGSANGPVASATFNDPEGLAVDTSGNIYVADSSNFVVRKIGIDGLVTTLAGTVGNPGYVDATGAAAAFPGPSDLVFAAGYLYLSEEGATIRRISLSGEVTTFAGTIDSSGNTDGPVGVGRFSWAHGLSSDGTGDLYVADFGNGAIRRVNSSGVITTIVGSPSSDAPRDGVGTEARLAGPLGVASDSSGNLLVMDWSRIRRVSLGLAVSTVAGPPLYYPGLPQDGTGTDAVFRRGAFQLASDAEGNLVYADQYSIRQITPAGVVTTIAGTLDVSGSTDGPVATATFRGLLGLTVAADGAIYVTDAVTAIRKIHGGTVSTVAGIAGVQGSLDGPADRALFGYAASLAISTDGALYVGDSNCIRKFSDGVVSTLAGRCGISGYRDGQGNDALFGPYLRIVSDGDEALYVTDSHNALIRKVTLAGAVTTVAGSALLTGSGDGDGATATFDTPSYAAVDSDGNLYVPNRFAIRKMTPAGEVTTVAGVALESNSVDGVGGSARLLTPFAITVTSDGTIYIMDDGVIRAATVATVPPAPSSLLATATSPSNVNAVWSSVPMNHFEVWRNSGAGYILAGSPTSLVFDDGERTANAAYAYKVRAVDDNANVSEFSNVDLATTYSFTDDPLTAGTLIKLAHLSELRQAADSARALAGLSGFSFADTLVPGLATRAAHLTELQAAIAETHAALGMLPFTYSAVTPGSTIRALELTEIRNSLK